MMDMILRKNYKILVIATSVIAFCIWSFLNEIIQRKIYFNVIIDTIIVYFIGIGLSYSCYILLNDLLVCISDKSSNVKKILFQNGYLDGNWGGIFLYKKSYRIILININQTTQSVIIRGKAYSLDGKVLGTMESESVNYDTTKQKLWASYNVESTSRQYKMDGLANMQYELNKKKIPFFIEGYAYQTMVNTKCKMIFYKLPSKKSIESIESVNYVKTECFEKLKQML